jgi:hypothetical protein
MSPSPRPIWHNISLAGHWLSIGVIACLAVVLAGATGMAIGGAIPWISLATIRTDGSTQDIGPTLQVMGTLLSLALAGTVPGALRVLRLETSHRRFHMSMDDVARAYHAAHQADRNGYFTASSEFDRVRERIAFLRDHPDLGSLEPQLLEVAAQMSHESRHLAEIYSVDKVDRARAVLRQRLEEAALFSKRIEQASHICKDLRKWHDAVLAEEQDAAAKFEALGRELEDVVPLIDAYHQSSSQHASIQDGAKAAA